MFCSGPVELGVSDSTFESTEIGGVRFCFGSMRVLHVLLRINSNWGFILTYSDSSHQEFAEMVTLLEGHKRVAQQRAAGKWPKGIEE